MIEFLQINLHRSPLVTNLLYAMAADCNAEILVISEQARSPQDSPTRFSSSDDNSAIVLTKSANYVVEQSGAASGHCWIQTGQFRVYSCYLSPNQTLTAFREQLSKLELSLSRVPPGIDVIVAGDFNSKSLVWGSSTDDVRGQVLANTMITLNLTPINVGNYPTFQRGNSESVIDVTFVRLGRLAVKDWRVLDDYTASDHKYIRFTLSTEPEVSDDPTPAAQEYRPGLAYHRMDVAELRRFLHETPDGIPTESTAEQAAKSLRLYLEKACDACMPPRPTHNARRRPVHWWSNAIAELRKSTLAAMRRTSARRDAKIMNSPTL